MGRKIELPRCFEAKVLPMNHSFLALGSAFRGRRMYWLGVVSLAIGAGCSRTSDTSPAFGGSGTATPGMDAATGGDDAGAPGVRFIGRFDTSDSMGPRFAWSGSGIVARFSGTSVSVKLLGAQQFTVVLDGVVQPTLIPVGGATTPLATGLADGPHTVELYRRTEANLGDAQFVGFDFGAGQLLAPPPAPDRRLEVIGDSITCGYGDEGADMNCHFTPDTENHYLAYDALSARALSADLVTIAWSGKGVVCNYGDDPTSCVDPLPTFYDRTLPLHANSVWDFTSWQPQAVVINLGTNDFSTAVDPTEADFEAGYQAFLTHLRNVYPQAFILCTVAPLLSGTDLTTAKSYIAKVVKAMNDAGDVKVKAFDIAPTDPADGFGCDYHPSLKTHQKMSTQLVAELKADLGW
jgi:lysophospholipase L1-like esterase